jgi:hypothetical protein
MTTARTELWGWSREYKIINHSIADEPCLRRILCNTFLALYDTQYPILFFITLFVRTPQLLFWIRRHHFRSSYAMYLWLSVLILFSHLRLNLQVFLLFKFVVIVACDMTRSYHCTEFHDPNNFCYEFEFSSSSFYILCLSYSQNLFLHSKFSSQQTSLGLSIIAISFGWKTKPRRVIHSP